MTNAFIDIPFGMDPETPIWFATVPPGVNAIYSQHGLVLKKEDVSFAIVRVSESRIVVHERFANRYSTFNFRREGMTVADHSNEVDRLDEYLDNLAKSITGDELS